MILEDIFDFFFSYIKDQRMVNAVRGSHGQFDDGFGVYIAEDDGVVVVADEVFVLAEVFFGDLDEDTAGGGLGLLQVTGCHHAVGRACKVKDVAKFVCVFHL